jgi:NADH:ubiquinone oxidoreductase subunit 6 (subunit J)
MYTTVQNLILDTNAGTCDRLSLFSIIFLIDNGKEASECTQRGIVLPICLCAALIGLADIVVGTFYNIIELSKSIKECNSEEMLFNLGFMLIRPIAVPLLIIGVLVASPFVAAIALIAPRIIFDQYQLMTK